MKSTRERMLTLLGKPTTARAMAQRLRLTVPTVAYHLGRIQEEGPALSWEAVREGTRGMTSKAWFLSGGER